MNAYRAYREQDTRRQPSSHAKQKVRDAFDAEALAEICTTWDFSRYAKKIQLEPGMDGRERFYWYKDNGSDILAIAHLDSVQDDGTCNVVDTAAGLLVTSGALDDRLGAYVILELLPRLGITCDWVLTTDEEMCQSTGEDFEAEKDYNWMFEFDRGGTDVVSYQYETDELNALINASGARTGKGSFSDIAVMDHLGCVGMNWGVGYQDYHGARSHAWLEDTFRMVARFVKFHRANADVVMPYHYERPVYRSIDDWDEAEYLYDIKAECGHVIQLDKSETFVELADRTLVCADCSLDNVITMVN